MTPPGPADHPLDFAAITFPSDRVTLAAVRKVHGRLFDAEVQSGFTNLADDRLYTLDVMIQLERLLARGAFEKARGRPDDYVSEVGLLSREECLADLTEHYRQYGVAEGPEHTAQLVRDLESQAAAQAGRRR